MILIPPRRGKNDFNALALDNRLAVPVLRRSGAHRAPSYFHLDASGAHVAPPTDSLAQRAGFGRRDALSEW